MAGKQQPKHMNFRLADDGLQSDVEMKKKVEAVFGVSEDDLVNPMEHEPVDVASALGLKEIAY